MYETGETSNALGGALTFVCAATTDGPVGAYPITPEGFDPGNYDIGFTNGTLTVADAALVVTVNDQTTAYGDAKPGLHAQLQRLCRWNAPPAWAASPSFAVQNSGGQTVGSFTTNSPVDVYTVVPSGLTSSNYAIQFSNGTATVTQTVLTVTADDTNPVYGAANPQFTARYSGFVNGEGQAALGGTLGFTKLRKTRTAASPVGVYPITLGGLASSDCAIAFDPGALSVTPAPVTVTANNAQQVYGAATPR